MPMLTCESKILLMQRLQDYARLDYRYYFQGEVGLDKLNSLSRKFAQQYDTELSKFQRARRKRCQVERHIPREDERPAGHIEREQPAPRRRPPLALPCLALASAPALAVLSGRHR